MDINIYINDPAELLGTLWECGGDPCLVETSEQAHELADTLADACLDEITIADEDFETAMRKLDLKVSNVPTIIHTFSGSCCGSFCLPDEWK